MAVEWIDRPEETKVEGARWEPFPPEAIVMTEWAVGFKTLPLPAHKLLTKPWVFMWSENGYGPNIIRAARLDRPKVKK